MEDLLQRLHGLIRQQSFRLDEEARHLPLPTLIDIKFGHADTRAIETLRFEITDK